MSEGKKAAEKVGSSTYELEKSVFVVAIADGYFRNRLRREGDKFQYDGRVKKNHKGDFVLPNWMKLDDKAESNHIKVKGKAAQKPKESKAKADSKSEKPKADEKKVSDLV